METTSQPGVGLVSTGRLDVALRELLKAACDYRVPLEICFFSLFGVQLGLTLFLPVYDYFWLPTLCVVIGAFWGFLAWSQIRTTWPCSASAKELWTSFGFPSGNQYVRVLKRWTYVALIGLIIPGWIGVVTWVTVFMILVFYPFKGRETLTLLAKWFGVGGVLVTLAALLGTERPWLVDIAVTAFALGAFAYSWVTTLATAQRVPAFQRDSIAGLAALVPLLLYFVRDKPLTVFVVSLVALSIVPVGLFLETYLRVLTMRSTSRKLLEDKSLRQCLTSELELKCAEDTVRESDGYYRICSPPYSSATETRVGETGYISWIGGPRESTVFPSGDCIVVRASSVASHALTSLPDRPGQRLHRTVASLVPTLGIPKFDIIHRELSEMWSVRVISTKEETILLKMPWDHPEIVVIPCEWEGKWTYPAGCGLFDAQGCPCFADYVQVRIALKEEVREAARSAGKLNSESNSTLQKLLQNQSRILPGCYETLLLALIQALRECSVPLLFEHDDWEAAVAAQQEQLLARLNREVEKLLPTSLSELVSFTVLDLTFDTYVVEKHRRESIEQLRSQREKMAATRVSGYREIYAQVLGLLFLSGSNASKWLLIERLDNFRTNAREAAQNARAELERALAQGNTPESPTTRIDHNYVPQALEVVTTEHNRFQRELETKGQAMLDALLNIQRALGGAGRQ